MMRTDRRSTCFGDIVMRIAFAIMLATTFYVGWLVGGVILAILDA